MTQSPQHLTIETLQKAIEEAAPHLAALTEIQADYDVEGTRIAPPRQPQSYKVRHMLYHLRKALARLDSQVEKWEHDEYDSPKGGPTDEEVAKKVHDQGLVAAELLLGALQLAKIGEFDLTGALNDMWARNARKFIPESAFAELEQKTYTDQL